MPTKAQLADPYAALPDTSRTQRDDPYADLPDSTAQPDFTTNLKGEGLYRMGTYDYSGGRVSKPEILIPFSRIQDALTAGYKLHRDEIRRYAKDVAHQGKGPSLLERAGNLVERMTEPVADRPLEWNTGERTMGSFIRSAPAALTNEGELPLNVLRRTYRGLAGLPGQTIQTAKGVAHGSPEALESLNPITMAESEARGYQQDVATLGPTAALANVGGDVATMYVAGKLPKKVMTLPEIKRIVKERIAPTVKYGEGEPTPVDILKKDAGTEASTRDPREVQRAKADRDSAALLSPKRDGGVHEKESYTYRRRVQGAGGVLRVLGAKVHETWSLNPAKIDELAADGLKSPDIHELDFSDPQSAEVFHSAISALKTDNPYAASVHVYDKADYVGWRMFLTDDGKAGFALKPDGDIVSVFSKGPEVKGAANTMLEIATQAGGVKLDCFDTILPEIYGKHGFKAVARIPWSDEYAPSGWDKAIFAKYNNGEPDVVFMVYALAGAERYKAGDGKTVADYDEAVRLQNDFLGKLRSLYDDWKRANRLTAGVFQKAAQMTTPTASQAVLNRLAKGTAKAVATAPQSQALASRERLKALQAEAERRRPAAAAR